MATLGMPRPRQCSFAARALVKPVRLGPCCSLQIVRGRNVNYHAGRAQCTHTAGNAQSTLGRSGSMSVPTQIAFEVAHLFAGAAAGASAYSSQPGSSTPSRYVSASTSSSSAPFTLSRPPSLSLDIPGPEAPASEGLVFSSSSLTGSGTTLMLGARPLLSDMRTGAPKRCAPGFKCSVERVKDSCARTGTGGSLRPPPPQLWG
mmetsp:Transcript_15603/g.45619  ORF Transcript_15603/g.45619 Transcript_15603/m.45619 type:complete len:203 (+) Transcript_15603:294-902(+)